MFRKSGNRFSDKDMRQSKDKYLLKAPRCRCRDGDAIWRFEGARDIEGRDFHVQQLRAFLIGSAALSLGACAMPDWDSFRAPDSSIFRPMSVTNLKESQLRPATAEDMVDAEGRCASAMAVQAPEAGAEPSAAQASVPLVPSGVALEMTECDVVKRAGQPEKVDLGTSERGERTATLTYIRGARPGIYHFVAGRLNSVERAPEPPPPPKPVRPAKQPPKPKPRTPA